MAAITVRNLPDETHRALKARARANGRSTEAEVRAILLDATAPVFELRLGSLLADIGKDVGGEGLVVERDDSSSEPPDFS